MLDESLTRLVDLMFAVPFIIVALVSDVVFWPSLHLVIVLLLLFTWAPFARQIRGETLNLKTQGCVALDKVAGASPPYRVAYERILPGVANTVMVIASLRVGALILTGPILSYLGVGIPATNLAWGTIVADGRDNISTAWWVSFFPGLAICFTVFAFNFLGDWHLDWFDPRLRQP